MAYVVSHLYPSAGAPNFVTLLDFCLKLMANKHEMLSVVNIVKDDNVTRCHEILTLCSWRILLFFSEF